MPKRSFDSGTKEPMTMDKAQKKTERSHEENQERAYIAASRRADRSIEARVQSARMASEIHKKRTGKGFRISEEIVTKEEMYEEEEDEFPRSYRLLHPNLQTSSSEMNFRVETYLSNRVAMSALVARTNEEWKANEINRLFDQSFPNAGKQAQEISRRMSKSVNSAQGDASPTSPLSPIFQSMNFQQDGSLQAQTPVQSSLSPREAAIASPVTSTASHPGSPAAQTTPSLSGAMPTGPTMAFGSSESAFTTELPAEARMLMAMDMGAYDQSMFQPGWENQQFFEDPSDLDKDIKLEPSSAMPPDFFGEMAPPMKWDNTNLNQTNAMDEPWDTFIDDEVWGNDQ